MTAPAAPGIASAAAGHDPPPTADAAHGGHRTECCRLLLARHRAPPSSRCCDDRWNPPSSPWSVSRWLVEDVSGTWRRSGCTGICWPRGWARSRRVGRLGLADGAVCGGVGERRVPTRPGWCRPGPGRYLSLFERERIQTLSAQDVGVREIARRLERSPSTISRELRRAEHPGRVGASYDAGAAHQHAALLARRQRRSKLASNVWLHDFVQDKLELEWSLEQISGFLRVHHAEHGGSAPRRSTSLYLPHRGALRRDLAGYVQLVHLPIDHTAGNVCPAVATTMSLLPSSMRRSLTWDQGAEMAEHATVTEVLSDGVFFALLASPWQRGSNENISGLLRQYFRGRRSRRALRGKPRLGRARGQRPAPQALATLAPRGDPRSLVALTARDRPEQPGLPGAGVEPVRETHGRAGRSDRRSVRAWERCCTRHRAARSTSRSRPCPRRSESR